MAGFVRRVRGLMTSGQFPGQSEDSSFLRPQGGGGGGGGDNGDEDMALINSGAITVPVPYLDIVLPPGYFNFRIEFDLGLSAFDHICAAVSKDAGANFYADTDNEDTYGNIIWYTATGDGTGSVTSKSFISWNSIASLTTVCKGLFHSGILEIAFPGDATRTFIIKSRVATTFVDAGTPENSIFSSQIANVFLNPTATVAPAYGRANLIRLLPEGNDDAAPPTSGENFTSGHWALYGTAE